MTTRREFLRRGALWVAAAAVVEPVARKVWAFPINPLERSVYRIAPSVLSMTNGETLIVHVVSDSTYGTSYARYRLDGGKDPAWRRVPLVYTGDGIYKVDL